MGRNTEKDAVEMASKNRRILENGFRIFAERSIDSVKMTDISDAAGIAISSLYRYYSTKPKLVMAISTWVWDRYTNSQRLDASKESERTAAEEFNFYLEAFLDLYRNHKDILRFNQFFNIYIQTVNIPEEEKKPFTDVVHALEARFAKMYQKGVRDGTLNTEMPEKKMFSTTLHLMLAAVTRYAVGLAFVEGTDAEEELKMQKELLLKRFCANNSI